MYKQAVLSIWYTGRDGKKQNERQGKFFYLNDKPVFLADMNPHKWWRIYSGYSISKQILDAFSKLKIRPQVIYRLKERGTIYITTPSVFTTKGVPVPYGGHEQYVLPIKNWKAKQETIANEPHDLPIMTLHDWMKAPQEDQPTATPTTPVGPITVGLIPDDVRMKLRAKFMERMAKTV